MSQPRNRHVELLQVRAGDLEADERNWRRHPEAQRRALRRAIGRLGFLSPVVARREGERLVMVDGHARAGLDPDSVIPVWVVDLSEGEAAEALATLDSLAMLAESDREKLEALVSADPAILRTLSATRITRELLGDKRERVSRTLETPDAVSEVGDRWTLGPHRVLCGDSLDPATYELLLEGEASPAAMVQTDPPYGVAYGGASSRGGEGVDWGEVFDDGKSTGEIYEPFARAAVAHVAPAAAWYVWFATSRRPLVARALEAIDVPVRGEAVWVKDVSPYTVATYRQAHEPVMFGWRDGARVGRAVGFKTDVWRVPVVRGSAAERGHPTMKPGALWATPIRRHTRRGELILDPFLGSGVHILEAHRWGRRVFGCELSPVFVDRIVRRWVAAGGSAVDLEGRSALERGIVVE